MYKTTTIFTLYTRKKTASFFLLRIFILINLAHYLHHFFLVPLESQINVLCERLKNTVTHKTYLSSVHTYTYTTLTVLVKMSTPSTI